MVSPSVPKLSTREKIVSAAFDRFHALGYTAYGVEEIVAPMTRAKLTPIKRALDAAPKTPG